MNNFKLFCERVLNLHQINADDSFGLETADDYYLVTYTWVIDTYAQTSEATQEIFKVSLEKAILQGSDVRTFFQEMGVMAAGGK